jgi:hypothetical protein
VSFSDALVSPLQGIDFNFFVGCTRIAIRALCGCNCKKKEKRPHQLGHAASATGPLTVPPHPQQRRLIRSSPSQPIPPRPQLRVAGGCGGGFHPPRGRRRLPAPDADNAAVRRSSRYSADNSVPAYLSGERERGAGGRYRAWRDRRSRCSSRVSGRGRVFEPWQSFYSSLGRGGVGGGRGLDVERTSWRMTMGLRD